MREFFQEKLQMSVEYFNPLRNVAVAPKLDPQEVGRHAHTLGEMVGLALRSVSDCPMEFNLLPNSVTRGREMARQRPYFLLAGLCVWLAIAAGWFFFQRAAEVKESELQKFKPKSAALKSYENKFIAVRKEIKELQDTSAPLIEASDDRQYWLKIIDDLNARLPKEYVWITLFDPGFNNPDGSFNSLMGEGTASSTASTATDAAPAPGLPPVAPGKRALGVRLHGLYLLNPQGPNVVDDFFKNLSESPYLENVKLALRSQPTDADWAFDYEIRADLKKPIALPAEMK
jgi:Tfp pilus assembly protein PilN